MKMMLLGILVSFCQVAAGQSDFGSVAERAEVQILGKVVPRHAGVVRWVDTSNSGKYALTAGEDGTVRVWATEDGVEKRRIDAHRGEVYFAFFFDKAKKIVSFGTDGVVRFWNSKGVELGKLGGFKNDDSHSSPIKRSATVTRDRSELAFPSADRKVLIRIDLTKMKRLPPVKPDDEAVFHAAYTHDNKRIVLIGGKRVGLRGSATLYDLQKKKAVYKVKCSRAQRVLMHPSQDQFVVGSASKLGFYNLSDGKFVAALDGTGDVLTGLVLSDDGAKAYYTDYIDGMLHCHNLRRSRRVFDLTAQGKIYDLSISRNESRGVVVGEAGRIEVFDPSSGKWTLRYPGHSGPVTTLRYSSDGKSLVSGGAGGMLNCWDAKTGERDWHAAMSGSETVLDCGFLSKDEIYAISDGEVVSVWEAGTGRTQMSRGARKNSQGYHSAAISPSRKLIAGTASDGGVHVWSASKLEVLRLLEQGVVSNAVAFSPDSKLVAAVGEDSKLRVWNPKSERRIHRFDVGNDSTSLLCFLSANQVCVDDADGVVNVWDLAGASPKVAKSWKAAGRAWNVAQVSPDKRWIALAHDREFVVLSSETFKVAVRVKTKKKSHVTTIAFSPKGRRIALGMNDGRVRVWDLEKLGAE